jgi:hypothetical protein
LTAGYRQGIYLQAVIGIIYLFYDDEKIYRLDIGEAEVEAIDHEMLSFFQFHNNDKVDGLGKLY